MPGRARRARPPAEAGYVLTDALVAMMLLSGTLVLSMTTLQQAREIGQVAGEYRRADLLLGQLMELGPHGLSSTTGAQGGFAWVVETATTGAEQPVAICRRQVTVQNEQTGRTFRRSTLRTCPSGGGS